MWLILLIAGITRLKEFSLGFDESHPLTFFIWQTKNGTPMLRIRIRRPSGPGSVFGIRIRIQVTVLKERLLSNKLQKSSSQVDYNEIQLAHYA